MDQLSEDDLLNLKPMTYERLKTFEGFNDIEKEEADEIIKNMEMFCEILYKYVSRLPDR
ncbi:hypothetical protein JMN32_05450 [Fulvivirga sp. 29W222]|uniref:Uncharacterized protein n=1 Tax=Fulvivirga marina TaxID=2494733 RepID=A0A937KBC1_9BACT|nr:hypothetical protein [Fulvivirga marina]MBL6445744.1 hypothetical protein [Fulvivirga marina]